MLGTLLSNRYRIDAPLGEGGMGVVYRAYDTMLNRPVAIKMLSPHLIGDEGVKRLLREAQAAAQLTHPNIVSVYDVIDTADSRLIIMEYVDGRPLAELIPMDVPRAIDTVTQVCGALQYAHARGIVHRDIKPENIVVAAGGTAKLMDFGLARSEGRSRMTQSGLIVGTVAYMAPEQVLGGTVDARTDLYSLGCVLYETLTGRKPFGGEDPFTVLSQQVNVTPVAPRWHNEAIPPTLDAVVMRLLAKDPAERYASATAVIEALDLAASAAPGDVPEPGAAPAGTATRTTLLEHIVRGKLVGRTAELAELREHLDRMLSGEGRLVLVSGEPGIGKTRLAEELAVYAHLRGAWVLRGHCYEQDVGTPYLPFVESLRQLLQHSGDTLQRMGDRAADLARLVPEASRASTDPDASPAGRGGGPALSPEDERVRAFEAAAQWVSLASAAHPLVFLLDDLHWADRASLRLLHHLARSTRTDRVLITGTYREMELDTEHPLNDAISQMNRERLFYRLPLRRLSEEATRALLSGLFDVETSQELAGAVHRETEGNPFFIEEVVKALVEEGKIYREGGRWQRLEIDQLEIPQSVKAAIGRRVQKASETTKRVLTIAAVIGREFDPDILVKISQLDEDGVLDALDEAVRLQVIRETKVGRGTGYAFEHALIRQTLYDNLNARRRARLHQQVGEALEALHGMRIDDHLEALAYHFGEAGTPAAEKGIEYNLRAARKAAGLYALEEGERRIGVALELAEATGDTARQIVAYRELGDLLLLFEERQRASDAYERAVGLLEAESAGPTDEKLELYLKFAEASSAFGTDHVPKAAEYARRAAEILRDQPDQPRKARALSLLAMHEVRSGDLHSGRAHAQEAIDLATRLNDRDELVKAYQAMAAVHRSSNEWNRFHEVVQKRRDVLGTTLTAVDGTLYSDLVQSYLHAGNAPEAERTAREFLKLAEKLRSPTATFQAYRWLGSALLEAGRWDEGLEIRRLGVELGRRIRGVEFIHGWNLAYGGQLLAFRGQNEQARAWFAEVEALPYPVPPEHHSPRMVIMWAARRLEDRELATRLLPRVQNEQPRCMTCRLMFYLAVGGTALWLGNIAEAEARLREARQIVPENPDPDSLSEVALLEAEIAAARGDLDAAVEHAQEALRHSADLPASLAGIWKGMYQHRSASILLHRRTPEDLTLARQLLSEALESYQQVGAIKLEEQAKALLADIPSLLRGEG
jgi:tetratricopeptide (TPR) repeat protein/predicted Ser/Thr protein kinase